MSCSCKFEKNSESNQINR